MLEEILRKGFVLASRRVGLVLLDVVWKIVWSILSTILFVAALFWATYGLRSIAWNDTGAPATNALIGFALLREFWNEKQGEIVVTIITMLLVSAAIWIVLEAFCRRKIVRDVSIQGVTATSSEPIPKSATYPFGVFLASGVLRNGILLLCITILMFASFSGASTIAFVSFLAFLFLLTLLDTLFRADALDLLGTDLFRVAGLLGILMSFEGMVAVSLSLLLMTGFFSVSASSDALVMMAATVVAVVFLNLLHSYLLIVRFSAIAIMRRNVVEI
jgi:hypothetical protein